jgi:CRP/FNR family transcriptional regulator, cyclic AMP receptor protein
VRRRSTNWPVDSAGRCVTFRIRNRSAGQATGGRDVTAGEQIAALKRFALFADVAPDIIEAIAGYCAWRGFEAGQLIIGHQDPSRDVVFLVTGRARASVYSAAGRQVSFRDIEAPGLFGELAAIDGRPRSASIEALGRSLTMTMPQAQFLLMLENHPQIALAVMRHLAGMVRGLTDRVVEFSTLAVRSRVHAELIRLAEASGANGSAAVLAPAPTHLDIANRIATHREAVTRELSRLEAMGVVAKEGRTLKIPDMALLRAMLTSSDAES